MPANPPTITCSPNGGRFTADTVVTLSTSRPCTIWYSKWPTGTWEKTAPGQTSVQVTLTESGPFRYTAFADDTGESAGYLNAAQLLRPVKYLREFIINQPGRPKSVCDYFRLDRYPLDSQIPVVNPDDWQTIPGWDAPRNSGFNNSNGGEFYTANPSHGEGAAGRNAPVYGNERPVMRWVGDTFEPDQEVIGKNDPPQGQSGEWLLARLQADSFTGYGAAVKYIDNEELGGVDPYIEVHRFENGVATLLSVVHALEHRGDGWFHFIRVTGQNPVRIQAGVYTNDVYGAGTVSGPFTYTDWDGDGYRDTARHGNTSYHVPIPDARSETNFIYVDILDSSTQRILSGQPGCAPMGDYEIAGFIAREVTPLSVASTTIGATTVRLSGTRKRGSTVSVIAAPPAKPVVTDWGWAVVGVAGWPDAGPQLVIEGDCEPGTTGVKVYANGVEVPPFSVPQVGAYVTLEPGKDLRGYVRGGRFRFIIRGGPTGDLSDGTYSITVKVLNVFGESPASDPFTVLFDPATRTGFSTPVIDSPTEGASVPAGSVVFSGTGFPMAPVRIFKGIETAELGAAMCVRGQWTIPVVLVPGSYSLRVRSPSDFYPISAYSPYRNITVT